MSDTPETPIDPRPEFPTPTTPPIQSPSKAKLFAALAKAQLEIKNVTKSREVVMQGRDGRDGRSYSYATLDAIIDMIREPLAKNGLAIIQDLTSVGDNFILLTRLVHESGQEHISRYPLHYDDANMKAAQAFGSATTYARRYSLQNMFLIAGDEDDDMSDETSKVQEKQKPKAPAAKPVTPAIKPATQPSAPKPEPTRSEQTPEPSQVAQDAFDTNANAPEKDRPATREEVNALVSRASKRGWPTPLCARFIKQLFGKESAMQMSKSELDNMMNSIETMTGLDATAMLDHMAKPKA